MVRPPGLILRYFFVSYSLLTAGSAFAETGREAWLRYAPLDEAVLRQYTDLPAVVYLANPSPISLTARSEFVRGMRAMLGRTLRIQSSLPSEDAFVLAVSAPDLQTKIESPTAPRAASGFRLLRRSENKHRYWLIEGGDDRGILYGVFRVLEKIARHQDLSDWNDLETPSSPVRWVNQWDNLDGSVERGYAGRSIFFEAHKPPGAAPEERGTSADLAVPRESVVRGPSIAGSVRHDLTRAAEYARLLASVGLNGCTVNNVNADPRILSSDLLRQVARIGEAFRPWGVQLSLSADLSSPQTVGGLETFDPLDPRVAAWWKEKADEIYRLIPDFGGFVIKADSEGRAGPSKYGRTPADAANVLARALAPHHGIVLYRGFVYNHHLDWRDPKADRARAGYDNFRPFDGKFEQNVVVQIKNGPIDFQVREPVSPLFAALSHTNQAIELQITQEYTGQQRHLVFLVPMWKNALDTDLRVDARSSPVKEIVTGRFFGQPLGGFVGVANVGLDENWLSHPMAMANLYGFGRLAWNPDESADSIAESWTRLTFGNDRKVVATAKAMLLASWRTYENYTGPLGAGTLTDIIHVHYGPGIESSERNGWGQWHRADHEGIGMDRTVATGTGYIGQYPPELARRYESLATTPDELLLFMHHVPYMYRLHSGKTVIQYIYDSHYEGAAQAAGFVEQWKALRGAIDQERFDRILALLEYQAGHAIVWRDAVCNWFYRVSGIPDSGGRVGHHSGRVEAESMQLTGYAPVDVTPWETASGGKAVICRDTADCSVETVFHGSPGWYKIAVQFFEPDVGSAQFQLFVNRQPIAAWNAGLGLPSSKLDGHTSTRYSIFGIALRPGDSIRVTGKGENTNPAALDYIEVTPAPH